MKGYSILVVEDSKVQREHLVSLCKGFGLYNVLEAEHGRDALAVIEAHSGAIDILLCDLEMPDMNGIDLLQILARQNQRTAVIIVSAHSVSLMSAVELLATMNGLYVLGTIQKPVPQNALLELLWQYDASRAPSSETTMGRRSLKLNKTDLQQALLSHQFLVHYQPQINLQSMELEGVEALVRLKIDQNLFFPDDFIELSEQTNLINELTYEIVHIVLKQQELWAQQGFTPRIAINMSAISCRNAEFSSGLMALLQQPQVIRNKLVFEITEPALLPDIAPTIALLARLRMAGVGVSVDNYGTGYSSLQQLTQIPFTELKIDKSLIYNISNKPHLQTIYESTVNICKKLGIHVVAEGVEDEADWTYLKNSGCTIAQGYFISPAMPAEELIEWQNNQMIFVPESSFAKAELSSRTQVYFFFNKAG